ncbi:MAG TPA: response regulator transcription factor [Nitrospiria bacterium]|nr:response regulator transcription factor [Nitrospiria bacterium]
MPPIKVLIVDDHTLFRKGLISLLQQQKGIEVVGEAKDGEEGTRLAQITKPDVILMDVKMPKCNGIRATQAIREALPETRIIMLTVSEEDGDLFSAIKAGARGYLIKNVEPDQLIKAIHLLVEGETVITHSMASKLLDEFGSIARKIDTPSESKLNPLTSREKEILQFLAKGESNKEIANALSISEHTVKIHLKNILKKLHMNNRIQAAIYAHEQGLIDQKPARKDP